MDIWKWPVGPYYPSSQPEISHLCDGNSAGGPGQTPGTMLCTYLSERGVGEGGL